MSSYQGSAILHADAKAVFDFVTNPENLCDLIPSVQHCDFGTENVVHLHGECPHGAFRGVATLHLDRENGWMRWDSKANLNYRGWLHVKDVEEGTDLSIHLEFDPGPEPIVNNDFDHVLKHHPISIQESLDECLQRIRSHVEAEVAAAGPKLS